MPPLALKRFQESLTRIDITRSRMEKLYAKRRISLADLESVYEALFLRAVTGLEAFLEELFVAILSGKIVYPKARAQLRMHSISKEALIDVLHQGGNFLDWLPFDKTEKRARIYLTNGRPFTDLDDGEKSMLKVITLIRNAIAHRSQHAISQFKDKVVAEQPLLPNERRPAGFLRSKVAAAQGTKFETYIGKLGAIAAKIAN